MTHSLVFAALFVIIGYGFVEAWPLISGPTLSIHAPKNGASVEGNIATITGKASRIATLTLNGAPLAHDERGNFSSILTFPHGGSILTFVATDRFGRRITTTRTIFVP